MKSGVRPMRLSAIYAQFRCSDLEESTKWFSELFGRVPDAEPMAGLREWHHGVAAGFQLFADPGGAGSGAMTLIVDDLDEEVARLVETVVTAGPVVEGDFARFAQAQDPDRNVVVLAEPKPS